MNVNELANNKVTITVTGEKVEVLASDPVKETLKKILQEKGIDSFTILVDGEEIVSTNDLPAQFNDHEIEVKRYVKAG